MLTIQTPNEVKLDFVTEGRRSGVPVLLLHGYTDSRRSYDRVLARMPKSINAIAVSQRGHGDSQRPLDSYYVSDFAADLIRLMDELNIPEAVIVGHSMGATVAQRFAIDYPRRTVALVLVGSFFTVKDHPAVKEFWETTVSNLTDPIDPAIVRAFQQSTLHQPVPPSFFDVIVQESLKVPARVWKSALGAMLVTDMSPELHKIQVPAQLIWGDQDAFASRSDQEALLAAIAGSKLHVYKEVGHSPHWEDPNRFVNDVVEFMSAL
jgi:non-heme chloroperoxidase